MKIRAYKKIARAYQYLCCVGVMVFFLYGQARAQTVSIGSSLTWAGKNSGADYTFENTADGCSGDLCAGSVSGDAVLDENGFVRTGAEGGVFRGPLVDVGSSIKKICFTYIYEGQIILGVRAGAETSYTDMNVGKALEKDFGTSTTLQWQAALAPHSVLKQVQLDYETTSGIRTGFGAPELSYSVARKKIAITGGKEFLHAIPIPIKIARAHSAAAYDVEIDTRARVDFNDIRFTAADGCTLLPHYIERRDGSTIAYIWVKIPQIPPSGTEIYVYWGNSAAKDMSSAADVFNWYDDFKDIRQWGVLQGQVKQSQPIELVNTEIVSTQACVSDGMVFEYCGRARGEAVIRAGLRFGDAKNMQDITLYASDYAGTQHCIAYNDVVESNEASAITAGVDYIFRAEVAAGIHFLRYAADGSMAARTQYALPSTVQNARIVLKATGSATALFTWARVRPLYDASVGVNAEYEKKSEIEPVVVPVFDAVVLDAKGRLVLEPSAAKGGYSSASVAQVDTARIVIPDIDIVDTPSSRVHAGISLDAGKHYMYPARFGTYYYLSKKDFVAGSTLAVKAVLTAPTKKNESTPAVERLGAELYPGAITVIAPNGGMTVAASKPQVISWSAQEYEANYPIRLSYSLDAGASYRMIAEIPNSGSYTWLVPAITSTAALVQAADAYSVTTVYDNSDTVFSIGAHGAAGSAGTSEDAGRVFSQAEMAEMESAVVRHEQKIQLAGQEAFDLLIKIGDQGEQGVNDGDVVIIEPAGHEWSVREREKFLIVPVYLKPQEVNEYVRPKVDKGVDSNNIIAQRLYHIDMKKMGLTADKISGLSGTQKAYLRGQIKGKVFNKDIVAQK